MGWNKITIDTLTSAEDMISYELTELGATGVEVEDHVSLTEEEMKVMYVDLLPDDIAPDDGKAKISCYFDENETNMGDIRRSDRRYDCCRDRSGNSIWNRFS